MRYKYVLLDWDGNLAKTLHIWLDACRVVLERRNIFKTDQEIAGSFGAFRRHLELWGVKDLDRADDEADIEAAHLLPGVELYPDVLSTLEILRNNGHKLALVTTSTRENLGTLVEKYNFKQLFDVVITGDDVAHHKPHPEPILKAMEAIGATINETIMVGDTEKDILSAQAAGIDSVLFHSDAHRTFYNVEFLKSHKPTFTIEKFPDLLNIVV
jgi:pyrophosphatase PpaX